MNAGAIRKDIEDAIAFNNAQACDITLKMDSDKMGEFLGATQKTLHKGYAVEIQFEINTSEYHFETLEAVSFEDKSVSRNDCVKLTELERNDEKGKYKYKIELIEKADDILIRPVCKELPKIYNFEPLPSNTTYPQDTSIKFTFTKPVNKESFTPADCISIYADDDLNSYFNFAEPVFSNDNKTLYIHTKPDLHILAPDGDKTIQTIHVSYDFSTVKDTDGMLVGIQGSFDYKINTSFTGEQKVAVWLPDNTQLGLIGSFAYPGSKSCVVKYSVDLQFNMNQQSYTFMGFEAKSYDDPSVSLDQYVTFTEIDYNDQTGIYKASIKVNESCADILINPVCKALPAVTKYTPETLEAQSSNTPIVINFNMPMEEADAAQSLFTKENISLIYKDSAGNNTDMRDYFEDPVFDSTKQILTIVPKIFADPAQKDIEQFILRDKKVPYADINVSFSENIVVNELDRQGNKLALKQDSKSRFAVRYKADIEKVAPAKVDFFVSASEITFADAATFAANKKFTEEALSEIENNNDKILQNRTKGEIWIYGKYYDKDSGVKTVYVTEKRTNDVSGAEVSENSQTSPYSILNPNGASFKTDTNGNTEFIIPYNTKSEGGAISISLAVEDGCYNHDDAQDCGVVVIKDDKAYSGFIKLQNTKDNLTTIFFDEAYPDFDEIDFAKDCYSKLVYKNCKLEKDVLSIKLEYVDKYGNKQLLNLEDFTKKQRTEYIYWSLYQEQYGEPDEVVIPYYEINLTGLDNDSIPDKSIRIIVTDDLGNSLATDYTFPKKPIPLNVREYPANTDWYEITFTDKAAEDELIIRGVHNHYDEDRDVSQATSSDIDCKFIITKELLNPENQWGYHNIYAVYRKNGLYGPASDTLDNIFDIDSENSLLNVITLKSVALASTPVIYSSPLQTGKTEITVYIDESSWNQDDYDRIYLLYKLYNQDGTPVYIQDFAKGQNSATVSLDTKVLYNNDNLYTISMKVFGEKDGYISDGTDVAIEQFTGVEHDNMPPEIKVCKISPEYDNTNKFYYMTEIESKEYESGIDYIIVNVPGTNKSYTYSVENGLLKFTKGESAFSYYPDFIYIPDWDMDEITRTERAAEYYSQYEYDTEYRNFTYKAYDKNGNYSYGTCECSAYVVPNFENLEIQEGTADVDWYCNFTTQDLGTYNEFKKFSVKAYKLEYNSETKRNEWKYHFGLSTPSDYTPSATLSGYNSIQCTKGRAYKAFLGVDSRAFDELVTNYNPVYFVVDTPSSGKYDYILPVSGTKKSVLVSSDSTTFVHTLVTKKPYEECKNWDEAKWEKNRRSIGEDAMAFTTDDHSPQKYNIPVTEIDSGDCYCVIAHFADGSTAMSEVMQKP